jgi:hypothetical protein
MVGFIDVDAYLGWQFDLATRNCWHLVRAGWKDLTGVDLGDRTPDRITTGALLDQFSNDVPAFTLLEKPESPSIVLMRRPGAVPHVGLFIRGRVLQMTPQGSSYMPPSVACEGWPSVEYYR